VKVPVSWLREYVQAPAAPAEVGARLASCGFAVDGIEDDVVDFDVTANRPDCLSIYGLAREASVGFNTALAAFTNVALDQVRPGAAAAGRLVAHAPKGAPPVKVSIGDPGCGRYALAVADVTIGPSPEWLAARLTAAGVRPINNVVDVTNYVMLELGHPMHAFDAVKLAGSEIHIRRARAGEKIVTIDGATRALDETMLVIADREGAVAVAGVMGGAASEVSGETKRVAFESAWFWPASVRATSKKLGLKTEASTRFERGADIEAPAHALLRALALLVSIGAVTAVHGFTDLYPRVHRTKSVTLRRARIRGLLGEEVPDADVARILEKLGFALTPATDGWQVEVPSFRVDIAREADLIEEVGRHWGFDRIPASLPPLAEPPPAQSFSVSTDTRLRGLARGAGLQEAVTFTFIERPAADPFVMPGAQAVAIANPLSEKMAVLRPSLLPGLLDALIYNRRREAEGVRLFELGSVFQPQGESTRIGWVLTGKRVEHWNGDASPVDFFDALGVAELLLSALGFDPATVTTRRADDLPWYVRGRAAAIVANGIESPVGHVGQLRPQIVSARGLDSGTIVGGEIDLGVIAAAHAERGAVTSAILPIPRQPSIVRDLSILVSSRLPAADVRGTIRANAPSTLVSLREFDRYDGKGVPQGQVSLSLRLTFRHPDRTLTDDEVQRAVDGIVDALGREHQATLRGR
jgi:phenylalanyl-tRNA synthetase beta chain